MKKLAIVALIATLTSCGSGTTETPATTDSTTVTCDSTKASCDSTKCDSTKEVAVPVK
jgi:hypothetical protein